MIIELDKTFLLTEVSNGMKTVITMPKILLSVKLTPGKMETLC